MKTTLNVIIIGGSGNLGRHVVSQLDRETSFTVSVLTRESSSSTFPSHIPVHRVGDAYPHEELVTAFTGQHAVVSAITAQAIPLQKNFVDAAVQAGVKCFIPSEFGHDTRQQCDIFPQLAQPKVDVVNYLKTKEAEGLSWTAIINGPFVDLALEDFLGFDVDARQATILSDCGAWSSTTLNTVALAVKNLLLRPRVASNRYLFIGSVTASQQDFLASFEKATAAEWSVAWVSPTNERNAALESLSKGDLRGMPRLLRYMTCVPGFGGNYLDYETCANQLLTLPAESIDGIVKRVVERKRLASSTSKEGTMQQL